MAAAAARAGTGRSRLRSLLGLLGTVVRGVVWSLLGAALGVLAAVVSATGWGAVLGVAAASAVAVALPPGAGGRVPFAVGWAVAVLRLALRRPEGDYVVAADPGGYLLLGSALVIGLAALLTVPRRPPRLRSEEPPAS